MVDLIKTNNLNILLYHQVGNSPSSYTNLDCFCTTDQFKEQMEYLKESNYKVISLTQALKLIFNKEELTYDYVVLSFDDGCEKFYDITYPILSTFDFAATIYPVAGYLGKIASWGKIKNPDLKILSAKRLKELKKLGVGIGAHTMDHLKLSGLEQRLAQWQIMESKIVLEQLIGEEIDSFSYPHGDFNNQIKEMVIEAGFSNALTCIPENVKQTDNIFSLPRKYVTYFDDLNTFIQKLNS